MTDTPLVDKMLLAAIAAGETIMAVYATDFGAEKKGDGSPVTIADQRAEAIIIDALSDTGIPILGEESVAAGRIPELGSRYFVVDPLDGTKEFIKRNGEFTVNIALVEDGRPVMGVVLAPAQHRAFVGGPDGAVEYDIDAAGHPINARPIKVETTAPMRVVASRSHGHAALTPICDSFEVTEDVSVGSSLKFCLVARGDARFYPRFTPTCEWDTAAGQAVLVAAGGTVLRMDGQPLVYGKSGEKYLNPFFVAADTAELAADVAAEMRRLIENQTGLRRD